MRNTLRNTKNSLYNIINPIFVTVTQNTLVLIKHYIYSNRKS